jgi:hypothetical protein
VAVEWTDVDAWILLALVGSNADLRSSQRVADYLNHSIPNRSEYEGTVAKLVGARLLEYRDGRLQITDAAKAIHRFAQDTNASPWATGGALDRALDELSKLSTEAAPPPIGFEQWVDVLELPRETRMHRLFRRRGPRQRG